jgi:hypothetical protein
MPQLFTNNAWSFLNGGITAVATSITLSTGQGARFPSPTGGDYFLLTLIGLTDGNESSWEIVKVTARATDVLTVVRAQEGTSGFAWLSGTRLELRMTSATADNFEVAYDWGDHGVVGYLTTVSFGDLTGKPTTIAGFGITDCYTDAEVDAAIAALVDASPAALDTLNELAAALGDDADFAGTMTTALAGKLGTSATAADSDELGGEVAANYLRSDVADTAADLTATKLNVSAVADFKLEGTALITGFKRFRALTQTTYDAIGTPDANTIYFING